MFNSDTPKCFRLAELNELDIISHDASLMDQSEMTV